jgi:ketosteroid isomerase-like protein
MSGMLEDDKAIRDLISRYCFLVDRDRDADAFTAMFTEDGVWNSASLGMRVEGRKQLRDFIEGVYGSDAVYRHLIANAIISIDGDRATARSYVHGSNLANRHAHLFHDCLFMTTSLSSKTANGCFKVRKRPE